MKNFNSIFNQLTAMPKRLAMVLTVLFTLGVGQMWGESETISFSSYTATGSGTSYSLTWNGNNSCTIQQEKASSNTNVSSSYTTSPRWYSGHYITFTPKNCTITEIVITATGSSNNGQTMTFVTGKGNIENTSTTQTTITGSWTSAFKLEMGSQCRVSSVVVTYTTTNADPYTITFNAGSGSCSTSSLTESTAGAGVTLPTATICDGWEFAGWATSSVANETTAAPTTLLDEGSNYKPTGNCTLYAVYKRTVGGGGNTTGSKTFTLSTIASANSWENGVAYTSIKDDPVTIVAEGGGNNGKWYTSSNGSWRMYSGGTVRITADGGTITSVTSTPSCDFTINKGEATFSPSARTDFTKFVVEYSVAGGSTTYYHSTPDCGTSVPTYTLTNTVSPVGYGTVLPSSVAGIPGGTTTTSSSNTYTVNGTTVTATPTTATAQYTYAFSKWQDLPATVNGDATVTAVFTCTTNKYTITWKNGDNVLEIDNNVEYDAIPQYDGATPTKAATAQYTYAFTGWNPAIASVTKDQTYTAQFSQTVNKYTITWKNADGTTLKTEEVAYGTTPSYTGTAPTKAATEQYTYTHNGWTPSVVAVTGNAEYTATFAETPRIYTIILNTNGGTINAGNVTSYKYGAGATLPTNVTKEHHQFSGWFDNSGCTGTAVTTISTTATGDKEYWAKWTELPKYTVTWSVDGNTTTEEVYSGDKATKAPTIDENNLPCDGADKFVGWTTDEYQGDSAPGTLYPTAADIPAITDDITFYAVFADYAD